jgi:hypothetical protein
MGNNLLTKEHDYLVSTPHKRGAGCLAIKNKK